MEKKSTENTEIRIATIHQLGMMKTTQTHKYNHSHNQEEEKKMRYYRGTVTVVTISHTLQVTNRRQQRPLPTTTPLPKTCDIRHAVHGISSL